MTFYLSLKLTFIILITIGDYDCICTLVCNNVEFVNLNVDYVMLDIGCQYSPLYGDIEENILSWIPQFSVALNVLASGGFNISLNTIAYTWDDDRAETLFECLRPSWLSIMNDSHAVFTLVQGDRTGRPDLNLGGNNIVAVWIHVRWMLRIIRTAIIDI